MSGRGCRGSHIEPGDLIDAVNDVVDRNTGSSGQVGTGLEELQDLAEQENVGSVRSGPQLLAARIEGLQNRLYLKYIGVDYEFFNSPENIFR